MGQVTLGLLKDLVRLEIAYFVFTVYTGMSNVFIVVIFHDTALVYWPSGFVCTVEPASPVCLCLHKSRSSISNKLSLVQHGHGKISGN